MNYGQIQGRHRFFYLVLKHPLHVYTSSFLDY